MANARGRAVDTTCLSTHGFIEKRGCVHRDYLSHCLRWSHVVRFMTRRKLHQEAHLLDVGCGREAPLAAILYSMSLTHTSGSYTGVDYGNIDKSYFLQQERASFHATWLPKTDLVVAELPRAAYDVIVCLEVVEHVEPAHAFALLRRMRELLAPGATLFLSTPCYDPHVGEAANHVNEMTHAALRSLLGCAGLRVEHVWGTFASQKDYADLIETRVPRATWDALVAYYDTGVLACVLAPLFPERARNCLWQLSAGDVVVPPDRAAFTDPFASSSTEWALAAAGIYDEVAYEL